MCFAVSDTYVEDNNTDSLLSEWVLFTSKSSLINMLSLRSVLGYLGVEADTFMLDLT